MGTGKSLLGRMLARRWGWKFVDTDSAIEEVLACKVAEIFERYGEAFFRQQETQVLQSLETQSRLIIATGGGAPTREENVRSLQRHAILVLLTAKPEVILQRVQPICTRPKLASARNPLEQILELLQQRQAAYACADLTVDTSDLSPDEAVETIEEMIEQWKPTRPFSR